MKTYVLTVSRVFPTTHKRKGEQTFFKEKINEALIPISKTPILGKKIHTIRSNYYLWKDRINEVKNGNAIISIRQWSGVPYRSKQIEFALLDKTSGVDYQLLTWHDMKAFARFDNLPHWIPLDKLAKNDGLTEEDFRSWFNGYNFDEPMIIIHFTKFRY